MLVQGNPKIPMFPSSLELFTLCILAQYHISRVPNKDRLHYNKKIGFNSLLTIEKEYILKVLSNIEAEWKAGLATDHSTSRKNYLIQENYRYYDIEKKKEEKKTEKYKKK